MHGMATLIKLVSSATCSLFLKNKIKIQCIDSMRDIYQFKLESIFASFLKVGGADLVPKNLHLDVVNSCTIVYCKSS